jgi:hypothetical protein
MKSYTPVASLLALICLCFFGCGDVTASKETLVGTWTIDKATMRKTFKKEINKLKGGTDKKEIEAMETMIEGRLNQIELTLQFKSDGTFNKSSTIEKKAESEEGTWEVTKADGDRLTVSISVDGKDASEGTVKFINNNSIEFFFKRMDIGKMPPGTKIFLKRGR